MSIEDVTLWLNGLAHNQLAWVVGLLLIAIVLFVTNKVRMDVVALLLIAAFASTGILTVEQATSGFSDPNVLLIAALFVIGTGLVRTGIAYQVGSWLVRVADNSEIRMLVFLMLAVAGLGSVMSSTGVVAIFIPVVMNVCSRMNIAPGRLMMPLSFAGLISGMMTLVATPPNLMVNSELVRHNLEGFGFFSVTPIGLVILFVGVGYMLLVRGWLVDKNPTNKTDVKARRTMRDLIWDYKLTGKARRLAVRADSPMIGHTLDALKLRTRYGAYVIGIERWRKFRRVMVSAFGDTAIRKDDVLLVDMANSDEDLRRFCTEERLEPMILRGEYFSEQAQEVGMAEVALIPESGLLGKSLRQIAFRTKYNLNVVGIRRQREAIVENQAEEPLQMGDTLLVIGDWRQIRNLQTYNSDFMVLNLPVEVDNVAPAISQAPHALFCLVLMIVMMVSNIVPNFIAALIACLLMGKFRCIDMESAYKSIHWPSLILIVGMLPFATALQQTGGIDLAANALQSLVGDMGPRVMLASLFIVCAVVGLFISNTATAVLMAPIAITAAQHMNVSVYPFAMVIAVAASAAFMTPVSSPVNTMVLAPGGYKFGDFIKIGVPFTIIVMVISVFLIPILFPFYP